MMVDEDVSASTDPTSLENLNDLFVPDRAAWWPPAAGWYVLGVLTVVLACWLLGLAIHRWWSRRYRRAAIHELSQIQAASRSRPVTETIAALNQLLKRVALAAWPRKSVANLSGEKWLRFLQSTASKRSQAAIPSGSRSERDSEDWTTELQDLAYSSKMCEAMTGEQLESLFLASARWIQQHRVDSTPSDLGEPRYR